MTTSIPPTQELAKAFCELYRLLDRLLGCAALDEHTEATDCLTVFDEYAWVKHPDADMSRFEKLRKKGMDASLSLTELAAFSRMLAPESERHLYNIIMQSGDALREYLPLFQAYTAAQKVETPQQHNE